MSKMSKKHLKLADELFAGGQFVEAERIFLEIGAQYPDNFTVAARLGHIALLSNRLEDAKRRLIRAHELKPEVGLVRSLLAEAHYRQDNFPAAANHLHVLGRHALARKLEGFAGRTPYAVCSQVTTTTVSWSAREPLPLITANINGQIANLVIDTGTGEMVLDSAFARRAGIAREGFERSVFAGGRLGIIQHGRADALALGDFELRDVPVQISEIQAPFAAFFPDRPVHGVIGTVLLYHFVTTVDYTTGVLRLQRCGEATAERQTSPSDSISIPFWLAGDHYLVAWGAINTCHPSLMFIDTGLTGAALVASRSTVQGAELELRKDHRSTAYGGGGAVGAIPFEVDELSLGEVRQRHVTGIVLDAFPLERQFGFRIGGLLAHDFFRRYTLTLDFARMQLTLA